MRCHEIVSAYNRRAASNDFKEAVAADRVLYADKKSHFVKGTLDPSRTEGLPSDFSKNISDFIAHVKGVDNNTGKAFSTKTNRDAEYLAAAKAGDLVTCKRMVEEAAKKAGYTTRAYHGTQSYGFTVFDGMKKGYQNNIGSHFSPEYDTANDHFGYKSDFPGVAPGVYEVFLNTGNQYETFDWFGQDDFYPAVVAQELAEEIGTPEATEILNKIKGIKFDVTSGDGSPVMLGDTKEDTLEVVEEGYVWGDEFYKENFSLLYDSIKQLLFLGGYDSIIYENGLEAPGEMDYIIWDPERIKSADPITIERCTSFGGSFNNARVCLRALSCFYFNQLKAISTRVFVIFHSAKAKQSRHFSK